MKIEKLTDDEREALMAADVRCDQETSDKALRIIDQLTEALAAAEDARNHFEPLAARLQHHLDDMRAFEAQRAKERDAAEARVRELAAATSWDSGLIDSLRTQLAAANALLGRWQSFTFARIGANWNDSTLVDETRGHLSAQPAAPTDQAPLTEEEARRYEAAESEVTRLNEALRKLEGK